MIARRLNVPQMSALGISPDQLTWVDEVSIGQMAVGVVGIWAVGLPLAMIQSYGNHPLALPSLVVRLLQEEPFIYATAEDAERAEYCERAGGVRVGGLRRLGSIYEITRARLPWWPGVIPTMTEDEKWLPRALR